MQDDFTTDNSLSFNGNFKTSNSVLKLNSIIFPGLNGSDNKQIKYDATLETKVFGLDTKFNLKTPNFSVLFDLGNYRWTKIVSGKERNVWMNPYVKFGVDQNLKTSDISLGFISTLENKCLLNEQVSISPDKGSFKLTGLSYLQYKCCKYFASLFLKYDLQNI